MSAELQVSTDDGSILFIRFVRNTPLDKITANESGIVEGVNFLGISINLNMHNVAVYEAPNTFIFKYDHANECLDLIGVGNIDTTPGGTTNSPNLITSGAVKAELDSMKAAFQDGVDAVYNAVVAEGVTPSASTPTAIADAIATIRNGGTAGAAQILSGYSAYSGKVLRSGSMTNRGAWSDTGTGRSNVTIPQGYHNGSGYVNGIGKYDAGYGAGQYQGRLDKKSHTIRLVINRDTFRTYIYCDSTNVTSFNNATSAGNDVVVSGDLNTNYYGLST